jgi:hypothetical protein
VTARRSDPAEQAVLTRLEAIAAGHAVVPDGTYRATTRDRLVTMAADRRAPATDGVLRRLVASLTPRRHRRLTAGLAGAALTLAAFGGVVVAAQGAHPGDLLYEVKRGSEQTRLSLAADGERGHALLALAGTRLEEAGGLVGVQVRAAAGPSGAESGPAAAPDARLLVDTLATMDAQTTQGTADLTTRAVQQTDRAVVEELVDWAGQQRAGLAVLSPAVPADARDAVAAAVRLVDEVAARSTALRGALACPSGPAVAGADALGPLPTACAAPPPAGPETVPGLDATSVGSSTAAVPGAPPPAAVPVPSGAVPRATVDVPRPAPPTPTVPARPAPSMPVPSIPVPSMPVPSMPSLPVPSVSLPVPGGSAPASAAPSSPGAVVPLPPGVQLCVPPLITVDCRPSGG